MLLPPIDHYKILNVKEKLLRGWQRRFESGKSEISVEELFAFVVGRPTAVIAGVPAGGVRVGFGTESDAVRHGRFLPKRERRHAGHGGRPNVT